MLLIDEEQAVVDSVGLSSNVWFKQLVLMSRRLRLLEKHLWIEQLVLVVVQCRLFLLNLNVRIISGNYDLPTLKVGLKACHGAINTP